jgi:hypothetical protein
MTPFYQDESVRIYFAECADVLPTLGPVDHAIFDPPYSDYVHAKSRAGCRPLTGSESGGSLNSPANFNRAKDLGFEPLDELTRGIVAHWCASHVPRWSMAFSDVESAHLWRDDFVAHGLDYVRTGAWVKLGATPQFTGDRPAAGFEAITICHPKGRKRWNGGGSHAVWSVPIVLNRGGGGSHAVWSVPIVLNRGGGGEARVHTTQKPEGLMSQLVAQFTDPGDTIVDPFMGSGTTLVAAKRLGRRAIGIERNREYCEAAVLRLQQGALDIFGEVSA